MIEYRDGVDGLEARHLAGFFEGWLDPPDAATHLRILERSTARWIAFDTESDCAVGFVTAVSDGVLAAYIPLLEVLPSHRGRGIGSELVRRMLGTLSHLYMVDVVCDPEVIPFYERFGMQPLTAMALRNRR